MAHNTTEWLYTGDIDLAQGGTFFKPIDDDNQIRAVQVTPCSVAGGPDNLFLIEDGYLHAGGIDEWQSALDVCGYTLKFFNGSAQIWDGSTYNAVGNPEGATLLTDAVLGAKGFDDRQQTVIQIGKEDPFYDYDRKGGAWCPEPDFVLHGNTRLHRYVAKHFL